jgi:FkbM family methyltransferase
MKQRVRQLVAKLSRRLVLRRRLPARFGGANRWVSPGAALTYFYSLDRPIWQDLYEFAQHAVEPGDVVWDVGANLGVFGFAAAHRAGAAGRVLAIEADPWLAHLMRRSAVSPRPGAAPVEVLCAAAADQCDVQSFETPEWARSGSHLASSAGASEALVGRSVESHPVVCISLDWLAQRLPGPKVLKLDVEGSELQVLQGAEQMIARHRPKILLEVYERSAPAVGELLHRHGYTLYEMSPDWATRKKITHPAYQTLALPG